MEIILLEKVVNLGGLGDKVLVRAGYGRNYLIPQGKAVPATTAHLAAFQERRAQLEAAAAEAVAIAQARADQIAALGAIAITAVAGEEGKLFGSVGTRDIADAVTAAGVELEKAEVKLPEGALRELGDYEVQLQLHSEVEVIVTISVVAE